MLSNKDNISCVESTLMRGGTSKGMMFLKENLPKNERDMFNLILSLMGAPDEYKTQIHGLGGGHSTKNKVGIVSKSINPDADIDYLFCQVTPHLATVNTSMNCGNFLSAVPLYAVYKKLFTNLSDGKNTIRIYNINTGQIIHATILTDKNGAILSGNTIISGVTGGFSPVELQFFNIVGSQSKRLLPTGNTVDIIEGIQVSIVDVAAPLLIININDILQNPITKDSLTNPALLEKLQLIRRKAGQLCGFNSHTAELLPKIVLAMPSENYNIKAFYYDPYQLHDSFAVTGAIALSSACLIDGTVATVIAKNCVANNAITIEHISGTIETVVYKTDEEIVSASIIRTAAILMDGTAFAYHQNDNNRQNK